MRKLSFREVKENAQGQTGINNNKDLNAACLATEPEWNEIAQTLRWLWGVYPKSGETRFISIPQSTKSLKQYWAKVIVYAYHNICHIKNMKFRIVEWTKKINAEECE